LRQKKSFHSYGRRAHLEEAIDGLIMWARRDIVNRYQPPPRPARRAPPEHASAPPLEGQGTTGRVHTPKPTIKEAGRSLGGGGCGGYRGGRLRDGTIMRLPGSIPAAA
jgi:hypothetical protein